MQRQIQSNVRQQKTIDVNQARTLMSGKPVVMVTGGCGYIGSHTTLELMIAGWSVVVIDNLCNSNVEALNRVYYLAREYYLALKSSTKSEAFPQLHFIKADIRDRDQVKNVLKAYNSTTSMRLQIIQISAERNAYRNASVAFQNVKTATSLDDATVEGAGKITHVIHFAALKAVGESAKKPLEYYSTNVNGLLNVLSVLDEYQVKNVVFSSSAVVYGAGNGAYISEDSVATGGRGQGAGQITNPYGRTKWMDEEILNDWCIANPTVQAVALRYFNPTGCHPSGLIGEDPAGIPTNLMPIVLQTYQRRRSKVAVYGSDYDTKDGSGVRDFIHVVDLAKGHVAAINKLADLTKARNKPQAAIVDDADNYFVYNLGTGTGYSVLEIIKAFAEETGVEIPFQQGERRVGDLGHVTANPTKAYRELGWTATHGLKEMCADLVKWANKNPTGYSRLRQLSVMAVQDQGNFLNRVRKASVIHRKQSMAPPNFGVSSNFDDIAEEEEEEVEAEAERMAILAQERADPNDISELIKGLVLDDDLFGMVAIPQEFNFTWGGGNEASGRSDSPFDFGRAADASAPRTMRPPRSGAVSPSGPLSPGASAGPLSPGGTATESRVKTEGFQWQ